MARTLMLWIVVVAVVVGGSLLSVRLWSSGEEKLEVPEHISVDLGWSGARLAKENSLPPKLVMKTLSLDEQGMQKELALLSLDEEEIEALLKRRIALSSEAASKDFRKIVAKFALWIVWMAAIWLLLRKRRITQRVRVWLYAGAVLLFGVVLSADPGPMGVISDAIVLLGRYRAVFPPRLIAMGVFLLTVLLANKFICSWGCQAGTLQDLLFRLNRRKGEQRGPGQIKLPFAFTNAVRIAFFLLFTALIFFTGFHLIEPLDPFRIFKPQTLGVISAGFIALLLLASLFVYRPWCHLFCPFGLIGWLVEKLSITKVRVDYNKCVACGKCEDSCPSTVMGAILRRTRVIPDCFSCGVCIEACPTQAVSFSAGKRTKPPEGKFDRKDNK